MSGFWSFDGPFKETKSLQAQQRDVCCMWKVPEVEEKQQAKGLILSLLARQELFLLSVYFHLLNLF